LLLLEKLPLAGIARVIQVCQSWLQRYLNDIYLKGVRTASVIPKAKGKLTVQLDELWSFLDDQGNPQWVWLAIDADTREIIGCQVGDRSQASTQQLWQSIPTVYRQWGKVYTDPWEADETVISSKRHFAVGKESGLTSYIERLNHTMRQRVSRLVRKTLSFSKKLENPIGAIWVFIHEYSRLVRKRLMMPDSPVISSALY
jgi:insertion element IS1 protein InsB